MFFIRLICRRIGCTSKFKRQQTCCYYHIVGGVTIHQGEYKLIAGLNCTKVMFNPDIPQAVSYRERRLFECDAVQTQVMNIVIERLNVTEKDEFLTFFPSTNIKNLVSCRSRTIFIIYATIKKTESTNDWYHHDCECNSTAYSDGAQYYCEKCNKHVTPTIRYKLLLNVADDTGSATFTVFYREGCYLMNKKGNEILEKMEKTGSMEHPPQEIVDLVHKEFLFKVEGKDICGRWFNPAFNVLKICKDQQIISKFKTKTITKCLKRNTPPPILEDSNTPIKRRSDEGSITEVVGSNDAEMFKKIKFSKN